MLASELGNLDSIPENETFKVAILYRKRGQNLEEELYTNKVTLPRQRMLLP